jgi:signal transduction histidine kinase
MDAPGLLLCGLDPHVVEDLRTRRYPTGVAQDGYRAIELAERDHPAVIVARADLPGLDPVELIRRLDNCSPSSRVVMIQGETDPDTSARLLRAGAQGLLLGTPRLGFLIETIHRVAEGGVVISPDVALSLVEPFADSVARERAWSRELTERALEIQSLSQAKSDFLANVSHELRTPLTIIKAAAATLARSRALSEQQADLLTEVERASDRLTSMVEGLLTEAHVDRGDFVLDFGSCNVADVVREGAREAGDRFPRIRVDVQVPEQMPAVVDARAVRGVVRQLVDNACRYSKDGGAVTVKGRSGDEGITVHVTDRGLGVHRWKVTAAFNQAFSPGEEVTTKERAGLGIGLNLARNLLALHGGILWAEPIPAGGTRVAFTIPLEAPLPEGRPDAPEPASSSSA